MADGSLLGKFAIILLEHLADIEIICAIGHLAVFAGTLLNLDAVEIWLFILLVESLGILKINDIIFVARVYHIPGVVFVCIL